MRRGWIKYYVEGYDYPVRRTVTDVDRAVAVLRRMSLVTKFDYGYLP